MLHFILAGVLYLASLTIRAAELKLTSPDGNVEFELSHNNDGHLLYAVRSSGEWRLEPAPLGVIVDDIDVGAAARTSEPQKRSVSEVFPWRGNKTHGTNDCNIYEIPVLSSNAVNWTLEVRVFNEGAGFRCRIPGSGTRRIRGESTQWTIPKDSTIWLQTNTRSYEGEYHSNRADQVPLEQEVKKQKQPTHIGLPMTVVFKDGSFGLVSEAALYHYSGLTLRPLGDAKFQAAFEDDPEGWSQDGPIFSPWRVIALSKDLNAVVNNDVIPALCDPPDPTLFPEGIETAWLRPGKAPCTWMVYGNDGAQWDRQKWFVDVSAAMGCEYLLVDAGWRTEKWGWMKDGGDLWARAAELCRYAAERHVGIILWHAYPEKRADSPGLTTPEAREELFEKCQKAGVKGVKIDFFESESKAVIEDYEDLARRAAKHQIMVNFHGANKPTGEVRTWPNEMTREGIREQEHVLWDALPLEHYGALPFTRMAAGHADFLPGFVQRRFLKNTTLAFQMASAVVFSTPFLCWPDNPEAYLDSPVLQFVRTVPVTWDETRVLPGSAIGETVIMARRKGAEWYVAVLNCRPAAQQVDIDLSFADLKDKELTIYRDGAQKFGCQIQSAAKPPQAGKLQVNLASGGGFLVRIASPKKFAGWK